MVANRRGVFHRFLFFLFSLFPTKAPQSPTHLTHSNNPPTGDWGYDHSQGVGRSVHRSPRAVAQSTVGPGLVPRERRDRRRRRGRPGLPLPPVPHHQRQRRRRRRPRPSALGSLDPQIRRSGIRHSPSHFFCHFSVSHPAFFSPISCLLICGAEKLFRCHPA